MPHKFFLFLISIFLIQTSSAAFAENTPVPSLPDALQALSDRGAQTRYLGRKHGLDGWITIYQGQEQYYYVTPDGEGFVMGVLFNKDGAMATLDQVRDLQKQGDDILDSLAMDKIQKSDQKDFTAVSDAFKYETPAQKMFTDIKNSNWIALGNPKAPVIYTVVDPQCPHCKAFLKDLRTDYIEKGILQVRIIPVGFREDSLAQAAFLLAAPDAPTRWFKHLDGDETALPAKIGISTQGVQKNLALLQAWKFKVTPITVYESHDGSIKIIRGRAKDIPAMIADLK